MIKRAVSSTALLLTASVAAGAPLATSNGTAPVARWDGQIVESSKDFTGLGPGAARTIETWRRFAENRGYRIDLDSSQRVLVVSDAERFENFAASSAIVDRVLDELEPLTGRSESPLVVLRAHSEEDLEDVRVAARAMDIDARLGTYLETGKLSDRRAVDARLAEELTRTALRIDAPHLSDWMEDGLASFVAAETTGRAIVDGEPVTLREVRSDVARRHRDDSNLEIDLLGISGTRGHLDAPEPLEAEALVIVAAVAEHYASELPLVIRDVGRRSPPESSPKYRQEEMAFRTYLGLKALQDLQRALTSGRRFRPS